MAQRARRGLNCVGRRPFRATVAIVARPEMILRPAHLSERLLRYQFLASFCFLADLIVL